MSLWWREQLKVSLAPDLVSARRRSRGLRRRNAAVQTFPVAPSNNRNDWRDALQTFAAAADQSGWHGLDLEVVMSGHFVHYIALPWTDNLSADDAMAYAQHQLQTFYGAGAAGWAVTIGRADAGMPRLVAAVELALLDELRAQATRCRLHLTSVRPSLDAACEALPERTLPAAAWLAVVERGRLSVSRLERGQCVSVRSAAYAADPARMLLTLLDQEAMCAGTASMDAATLYLQSVDVVNCDALRSRGLQVLPSELAVLQ